ncbi:hypothetical protein [Photobacterium damselae]|uniref:hypothetical protein n=1 Tax=Photobacterium damselae TaxID=38293 RepID=UPI001EFDB135|nr:hypothetical protein [Photobacterium damselae]MCG9780579.1 hypothetical protein [Photobacterium damselae]
MGSNESSATITATYTTSDNQTLTDTSTATAESSAEVDITQVSGDNKIAVGLSISFKANPIYSNGKTGGILPIKMTLHG